MICIHDLAESCLIVGTDLIDKNKQEPGTQLTYNSASIRTNKI